MAEKSDAATCKNSGSPIAGQLQKTEIEYTHDQNIAFINGLHRVYTFDINFRD